MPDVFWKLFAVSGHVGAYLLHAWYGSPAAKEEAGGDHAELSSSPSPWRASVTDGTAPDESLPTLTDVSRGESSSF